jgi:RNA 3'-terminal phosphate cyclase (ATP)
MMSARDILNRARWATADLHRLEITVVHRGAPDDRRALCGSRIVDIGAAGVELAPEGEELETAFVPYHRFVSIRDADGLIWDRHGSVRAPLEPSPRPRAQLTLGEEVQPRFSVVLPGADLTIDGSAGEGGGQILRSSLALSMVTGKPFTIERIRAGRKKPGLMRQHLTCVRAAAAVCAADVEGAELGSTRLVFRPGPIRGGSYEFDVGGAGSTSLVLQTVALPLATTDSTVRVRGGTHALWAPIYEFLAHAWLPRVQQAGAQLELALKEHGFYPAGGGEVVMTTQRSRFQALHLQPSTDVVLELTAIVAGLPEGIARRELTSAAELLAQERVQLRSATVRSAGPGNAIWISARDQTGACNVFSAIGERGVSAEDVGVEVANSFLRWRKVMTHVEEHLADQLMLPIALAGEGSYTCSDLTLHSRTNIEVIHAFTGRRLRAWDLGDSTYRIAL